MRWRTFEFTNSSTQNFSYIKQGSRFYHAVFYVIDFVEVNGTAVKYWYLLKSMIPELRSGIICKIEKLTVLHEEQM